MHLAAIFGLAAAFLASCATEPVPAPVEQEPDPQPTSVRLPADRLVAEAFPLQVVVESAGDLPADLSLAIVDDAGARVQVVAPEEAGVFPIPADGLVAGSEYALELKSGDRTVDSARLVVGIEMPPPQLLFPKDGYVTIDRNQTVGWQPVEEAAAYLVEAERNGQAAVSEVSGISEVSEAALPLRGYGDARWRVRWIREDGLRSPASEARRVVMTLDPPINQTPAQAGELWATEAYLTLVGLNGAEEAQVEVVAADTETDVPAPSLSGPKITDGTVVFRVAGLVDRESYRYRARGRARDGDWTTWTQWVRFTVRDIGFTFIPVHRSGEVAFSMGYNLGSEDEAPAHSVIIARTFSLQDAPLTNSQVAEIVNVLIDEGMAEVSEADVTVSGRSIIRLGELDYGSQFGLVGDGDRLAPAPGRATHPAVGMSWFGALVLANRVSTGYGLETAYGVENGEWNRDVDAVRLPTEAEWALSARGDTETPFPWGFDVSSNRANYYRSFDPFEDVAVPFTGNGGPTAPVRYFDGSTRSGFRTLPNRSPFGHWDVVGNVWEWCWDWYDADIYADRLADAPSDPVGPESGEFRVVRGCAWNTRTPDVRVTNRGRFGPDASSFSIGVRLAMDLPVLPQPRDDETP